MTKSLISIIIYLTVVTALTSCSESTEKATSEPKTEDKDTLTIDAKLAKELGADEYGMKQYVIAFLKKGPNRDRDSAEAARLQTAHLQNITRLAEKGKLVVAGPFMDDTDLRGIYIFNVTTVEEAKALTETDPAIIEGSLVMELHPWYGSAALMGVTDVHKKIQKKSF